MKIKIWENRVRLGLEILLWDEANGKRWVYHIEKGRLKPEELLEGMEYEPTIIIPIQMYELIDAIEEEGFKLRKQAKFEGELDATKLHLKDLQKLLKLD